MLGKCSVKYVTDALGSFSLYRTIANAADAASSYPTLASHLSTSLELTNSPKGSTNVIYLFSSGNAAPINLTVWMSLFTGNPVYYNINGTVSNMFVNVATQTVTAQTLYTFTGLPAARYIITNGTATPGTVYLYTAMTGPPSVLYENV